MRRLNLHEVYVLGSRLKPLEGISDDTKTRSIAYQAHMAREALIEILKDPSPLLDAAKRATGSLIGAITDIVPRDWVSVYRSGSEEEKVGFHAYDLRKKLEAFESVLSNEMPGIPSFLVLKKGIYSTDDLIFRAEDQFPPSVLAHVPKQARWDIRQAGKCLAFELPTACAFHLWRAVEDAMCVYYEALTGKTAEDAIKNKNWSLVIKSLAEAGAEQAVTKFLDHIREEYRNPQLHSEEIVEMDRALALFGTAASAITQLVLATQKAKEKRTPALPGIGDLLAANAPDLIDEVDVPF